MQFDFYPSKEGSSSCLILVGGTGDTKERYASLAVLLNQALPSISICATTLTEKPSLQETLTLQQEELVEVCHELADKHQVDSIHIYATSMGAYSTCFLLANTEYSNKLRQVIFYDPADYYLDNNSEEYTWTGFAEYSPGRAVVSSLLKNVSGRALVHVVHLTLRNYGPSGYSTGNYVERGRAEASLFPRLNSKMVKTFYTNLPEKNRGEYLEVNDVPHGFIGDGDIPQNLGKITATVESLLNVWRGVVIEESLSDESLIKKVNIVGTKTSKLENENRILTFHKIEVPGSFQEKYVEAVKKNIKDSFYTHLCKDDNMIVIFHNKVFTFTKGDPQLKNAREYGKSIGIIAEQMPFEHLINNPFD